MPNNGTTGTIFITSLVWRGPWLGIEPGTSRTRSQHSTNMLSRRYSLRCVYVVIRTFISCVLVCWRRTTTITPLSNRHVTGIALSFPLDPNQYLLVVKLSAHDATQTPHSTVNIILYSTQRHFASNLTTLYTTPCVNEANTRFEENVTLSRVSHSKYNLPGYIQEFLFTRIMRFYIQWRLLKW